MGVVTGDELLRLPVRLRGIELGRPVDLLVDLDGRALGLDVRCGDGVHRFLPLAAAQISGAEIALDSPLLLLEDTELAFYKRKGRMLGTLRGATVARGRDDLGALRDLLLAEDGTIEAVVVADARLGERVVPFDDSLRVRPARRTLPAA
jgi:hypothetical protein